MRGRKGLPNDEEWLSTEQAAEAWNRVFGNGPGSGRYAITGQTMRLMCRRGVLQERGVKVMMGGGRYYFVSRGSLLAYMRDWALATAKRAERELERE